MHLYTNDIKKVTKYQQDSTIRTASEKRLDRVIKQDLKSLNHFEAEMFAHKPPTKQVKIEETDN